MGAAQTNLRLNKLPEDAASPTSRVHAGLGGIDRNTALLHRYPLTTENHLYISAGRYAITNSVEQYQFRIRIMAHTDPSHRDHVQRGSLHFGRVG